MRSTNELVEQAGDWSLMRLLLERPSDTWRQQLLAESKDTVDPELTSAVQMAHIVSLQAGAVRDDQIGEAIYLEGIAEWLRRGHLAWFTEQIASALNSTQVCYLSHVAHALEQRVLPTGESGEPTRRPSESTRNREAKES